MRDELRALGSNAVPALVTVLNSRSWGEVQWIQKIREKLPSSWAKFLPDESNSRWKRQSTVWVLGELGTNALSAIPALELYRDRTPHVGHRASAIIALAKIQPTNPGARSNLVALISSAQQSERFYAAQEFGAVPLPAPDDKGSVEESTLFQVLDQCRSGLIDFAGNLIERLGEIVMVIPVGVIELHEANAAFDKPSGQ